MSERGVFAVDRGIWEHDLLASSEPFSRREAWLWLVSEAAWKPHRRRLAGHLVEVGRGQLAASLRFIAGKWRWSEPRVRRFLLSLNSEGMIGASTDAGVSLITICKYDEYQRVSLPSDAPNDSKTDAAATQQRRKVEDKEDKETTEADASVVRPAKRPCRLPDNWDPSSADRLFASQFLIEPHLTLEIDKFRDHWRAANGPPSIKRDWSAAWRNWCRNSVKFGGGKNGKAQQSGNIVDAADRVLDRIRQWDAPAPSGIRGGEGAAHVRLLSKG